jgi:hypothetical protein
MTQKEKAKELVDKYYYLFSIELENTIDYRDAKQCALIAVDLAIEYNEFCDSYWQEVKHEIQKL